MSNNASETLSSLYRPLVFRENRGHDASARQAAVEWLNYYVKPNYSVTQWRKHGCLIPWLTVDGSEHSIKLRFDDVVNHIKEHKDFKPEQFGIPSGVLATPWADRSIQFSQNFLYTNPKDRTKTCSTFISAGLGNNFPVNPALDREGIAFSPAHQHLYKSILTTRNYLVNESDKLFNFDETWMQNFFSFFNSAISIIEAALIQIYYKAKYDGKDAGLHFDPEKMGDRITGRVIDKFKWIHALTGKHLENVNDEMKAFKMLKKVRNHLNHFDPPVFACTIEEIREWLNLTPQIGSLLWKIRRCFGLPPSKSVLSLIFIPEVEFVPANPKLPRVPQPPHVGYLGCCWEQRDE